jgi:hypothetical protein
VASWIFGSYTVPDADAPLADSVIPEAQEDNYAKETPVGATGTASTVAQLVSAPSIQATLSGWCSAATKTAILALNRTTFTIKTPFDTTGRSWLQTRSRFVRWTSQNPSAVAGTDERFWYTMELLGR